MVPIMEALITLNFAATCNCPLQKSPVAVAELVLSVWMHDAVVWMHMEVGLGYAAVHVWDNFV